MYVCKDWMQEAEDDAKGLPDARDFWLSHQKNPFYRSLMKIHQHGTEIFNKMCSFEVSIGLVHLILNVSSKNPCYISLMKIHQHGAEIFDKMCGFEVSIGFYPSFWSSHQKTHCYRSLMKTHQHGDEIFNKMCSFEVSIGILCIISIISLKEQGQVSLKSMNMQPRYLINVQFWR